MNPSLGEADRLLRIAHKDRLASEVWLAVEELVETVHNYHAQQAAEARELADQLIDWAWQQIDEAVNRAP